MILVYAFLLLIALGLWSDTVTGTRCIKAFKAWIRKWLEI